MRKVNFKSIGVRGFRTIHDLQFSFDEEGLTIVTGDNGNGKTSVFEALYFALYGENLKGSTLGELLTYTHERTENWGGLFTGVVFSVEDEEYELIRTRDHDETKYTFTDGESTEIADNELMLRNLTTGEYETGKSQNKGESQEIIDGILGADASTFLNSVLFGQNLDRLSRGTSGEIYTALEKIFPVKECDEFAKKAEDKAAELKLELVKTEQKLEGVSRVVETKESDQEILRNQIKEIKEELEYLQGEPKESGTNINLKEVKEHKEKYEKFEKNFGKYRDKKLEAAKKQNELDKQLNELDKYLNERENQFRELKKTYQMKVKMLETKECPECGSELEPTTKDAEEALELKEAIMAIKEEYTELKDRRKEFEEEKEAWQIPENIVEAYENAKEKWTEWADWYENFREEIEKAEKEKEERDRKFAVMQDRLEGKQENLESTEKELAELTREADQLTQAEEELKKEFDKYYYWAKKGFSNRGLKGYLFNVYMEELNAACRIYGEKLGIKVKFSVELEKKSKRVSIEVTKGERTEKYRNFSGGEKARVDICVALAMNEILKSGSVEFNVLILDEIFENLDEKGMEAVREILERKARDKAVYLITHWKERIADTAIRVIEVEKENNQTEYIRA